MIRQLQNSVKRAAWLPLLIVSSFACSDDGGPEEGLRAELNEARALWESFEYTSYGFQLRFICFCPPDLGRWVDVGVQDGAVMLLVYADTGEPVADPETKPYTTIAGLFDLIEDALEADADSIAVEFDQGLGFPADAMINYEFQTADEELGFETRDVAVAE